MHNNVLLLCIPADAKPASGFSDGGRHVVTHDSGGPFKTRFEDMRRDFFKDSSFSSQPTQSSGDFRKSESRSVRTFTVTEGSGPNKVTKKVTEETIIKPDGEKIVNRKEEVTSGGSSSSYGGSGAMAGDPFKDFDVSGFKHLINYPCQFFCSIKGF